jgi:hypothetical protein
MAGIESYHSMHYAPRPPSVGSESLIRSFEVGVRRSSGAGMKHLPLAGLARSSVPD